MELDFVQWDCYSEDPPKDLDVFVYDSVFLYDFLEKGCLMPLAEEDIERPGDLIPCALSACCADGVPYALPQLLCANLLFCREGDDEMKNAENIGALYRSIGVCADPGVPPAGQDSLLVSIPDRQTLAFWYLETRVDLDQEYAPLEDIPEAARLDPVIMETLLKVQSMAGKAQMTAIDPSGDAYIRGKWFASSTGRALIGYSETLSVLGEDAEKVAFHRFSMSDEKDIPMLYADIASVNASVDPAKRPLAVELMNIITGEEALSMAFSPLETGQAPQYLLGARLSVYDRLAVPYPVYGRLKEIVSDPECRVFVPSAGGRALTEKAASVFKLPLEE